MCMQAYVDLPSRSQVSQDKLEEYAKPWWLKSNIARSIPRKTCELYKDGTSILANFHMRSCSWLHCFWRKQWSMWRSSSSQRILGRATSDKYLMAWCSHDSVEKWNATFKRLAIHMVKWRSSRAPHWSSSTKRLLLTKSHGCHISSISEVDIKEQEVSVLQWMISCSVAISALLI